MPSPALAEPIYVERRGLVENTSFSVPHLQHFHAIGPRLPLENFIENLGYVGELDKFLGAGALVPRYERPEKFISSRNFQLTPWQRLEDVIDRWTRLRIGWDGEEGVTPSRQSLFAARELLDLLRRSRVAPPAPYIASDGEIGFRWCSVDQTAIISFLADNDVLAFCPRAECLPLRLEGGREIVRSLELIEALQAFC